MPKRRFGRVRALPSGRFQARYPGPDGIDRPAPYTFASKKDAEKWLVLKEAEITEGRWTDPDAGKVRFETFAQDWVNERAGLRPRTVQLYKGLLRLHLLPTFADKTIAEINVGGVRKWRTRLLDAGTGPVTVAKAYRLLKAILNTAVDDGLIPRNPCRIKGAGKEESPERPVLTLAQVFALADAIAPRFRALVLLAVFSSLRWGELVALRRRHLDTATGTIRVEVTAVEIGRGGLVLGPPKSDAGKRVVTVPAMLFPELRAHLATYAQKGDEGLIFVGPKGAMLRRGNFAKIWKQATEDAKIQGFHFHDLRHTGNHLASQSGASLRELMARMGHASTRAALIYQHRTAERDRAIAQEIGKLAQRELRRGRPGKKKIAKGSGTQRARKIE
ncbi:tyrosine-type recombinase/integrase [Bailinhaonella thermotolerans]|nr:site-specific integrase [Bailinhaonella thermotolerans]